MVRSPKRGERAVTVFITQEVPGRDLSDAASFGELVILLPAKHQAALSAQPTANRMRRLLSKFTDKDYLLLSGDPVAIAIAGALATQYNNGRMKMLRWDRLEERYYPIQVDLYHKPEVA
jgi:hypothetical protein